MEGETKVYVGHSGPRTMRVRNPSDHAIQVRVNDGEWVTLSAGQECDVTVAQGQVNRVQNRSVQPPA